MRRGYSCSRVNNGIMISSLGHDTVSRCKVGAGEYNKHFKGLLEPVGLVIRLVVGSPARLTWHKLTVRILYAFGGGNGANWISDDGGSNVPERSWSRMGLCT